MAECSRSAARWTRSSGREAPSRKLNAERVWKSTKLVIHAFHRPLVRPPIQIQAVQRAVAQREIVFIAIPAIRPPPLAARSPRPGDPHDFSLKPPRPQAIPVHPGFQRRPEIAERQRRPHGPCRARTVGIEQFRIADIFLAYQPADLA